MSTTETDEERARRFEAQSDIATRLAKILPDAEDVLTDLEWASMGIELMAWNQRIGVPLGDPVLAPHVPAAAWGRASEPDVSVEVSGVFSISREAGRFIAQFMRGSEWPVVTRVLLVVRVGEESWVHAVPILFANELSLYADLGTETEFRDRLQEAREALVRTPDAAVSFEFILSADDGDPTPDRR